MTVDNNTRSPTRRGVFSLAAAGAAVIAAPALLPGPANAADGPLKILNVSYDPTRELYRDINAAYSAFWKSHTGQQLAGLWLADVSPGTSGWSLDGDRMIDLWSMVTSGPGGYSQGGSFEYTRWSPDSTTIATTGPGQLTPGSPDGGRGRNDLLPGVDALFKRLFFGLERGRSLGRQLGREVMDAVRRSAGRLGFLVLLSFRFVALLRLLLHFGAPPLRHSSPSASQIALRFRPRRR